jgi:predicted O-methyltransferase YrrM
MSTRNQEVISDFSERLIPVAEFLGKASGSCREYVEELVESRLVERIKERLVGVPQFAKANITGIESFHLYRTFLYVVVRWLRPEIFLETGVLHGFSSAFILQGMKENSRGRLVSIDLPHREEQFIDQGTHLLPANRQPGWAIPIDLMERHDLRLGDAVRLLPDYFLSEMAPDIFLHDSDHDYEHMTFELALAYKNLMPGSLLIVDNIEWNTAFQDFCQGAQIRNLVLVSYPKEHPEYWLHGIIKVP